MFYAESSEKDEEEKMLRLELDEIRRLSEEALKIELAQAGNNTTTDEVMYMALFFS